MKKALALAALALATFVGTTASNADPNYELKIEAPAGKQSAKGVAKVSIQTKGDWHINKDYPTKLTVTAPDGVSVDKAKQTASDAKIEETSASFNVVFTSSSAGKKDFTGELKFALCSNNSCVPTTAKVEFSVDVK